MPLPEARYSCCGPFSATVYRSDVEKIDDITRRNATGSWTSNGL
ncbi:hypothetical protein KDW_31950 [Dictyobacter vulcani]|uniref:Uncharacterized protein n=1 Tax=Dictyobacter vulcani TaxID=2607529 RepID=A0A5J4KMR6_9CHLR|nr:hypothetical protein KDW_31950 [Dictyobacter vulcani]